MHLGCCALATGRMRCRLSPAGDLSRWLDASTLASRSSRRRVFQQRDRSIERFYDVVCVVSRRGVIEDIDGDDKSF